MRRIRLSFAAITFFSMTAASLPSDDTPFTKRGPLDGHAEYVRQVLGTLDLEPGQQTRLEKIVDDGHAAWRAWFRENQETVDMHANAVRAAKESGDKEQIKKTQKEKKVFMHTAPSLLRQPEPVRAALSEVQRPVFDERLDELKRGLHKPRK